MNIRTRIRRRLPTPRFITAPALLLAGIAAAALTRAEEFAYALGDTVSNDVPAPGAGRFDAANDNDVYTFNATAGQLAFFQGVSQADAFKRNLRWQLIKPGGGFVFNSYFSFPIGRVALPETGAYKIRFYSDATDPTWIGAYSFTTSPIPPDQTFAYVLGTMVSQDHPSAGQGGLEVAGAEDNYTFTGNAGQILFAEPIAQDASFNRNLRWQLVKPSGGTVFSVFFSNPIGRLVLPEAGTYRIRFYTDAIDPKVFGSYSFRMLALPPDQNFPYAIGDTVSDGVPAPGAGRLEQAGTEDTYPFTGQAGQVVFFEAIDQDASFNHGLRWQLIKPSGGTVFSSFFSNPIGRTVLPDSGGYRIRLYTDANDPKIFGAYSFRTRGDVTDQQFAIKVGDRISDGQPAAGAGNLETPGATDAYVFTGRAGQAVNFESISQAPAFQNGLRWKLLKPSGGNVFASFFASPQPQVVLPEPGAYRLTLYTDANNPSQFGTYSFRLFSPVHAHDDFVGTPPGQPVVIPFAKLLFNDTAEDATDVLHVEVGAATTTAGGALSVQAAGVKYTPKPGFQGADSFTYVLVGALGGTNQAKVSIGVAPEAAKYASVVNLIRSDPVSATFCFLGTPGKPYMLEASTDLLSWTAGPMVPADAAGIVQFDLTADLGVPYEFRRARLVPVP